MKILGIVYQSQTQPTRISMFNGIVDSLEIGQQIAIAKIIKDQGDLNWMPILTTIGDIILPTIPSLPIATEITKEIELKMSTPNWIMDKIISNKDTILFDVAEKYLSKSEVLYIKDKIK